MFLIRRICSVTKAQSDMKWVNWLRWVGVAIAMTFVIAACQKTPTLVQKRAVSAPSSALANCRVIPHAMGETKVCGQPQRIVVLGPYVLEPLLALGVQPVAFGDHIAFHQGDYTYPSGQIPYLGQHISRPLANLGLAYNPSLEAILKVQPDLILGTDQNNAAQYEIFSKIAPTLLFKFNTPEANLKAIAQVVNQTERAEQLLKKMKQDVVAARNAFAPIVAKYSRVLLLSSAELREIYLADSPPSLCNGLLKELGFQLISAAESRRSSVQAPPVPISLEVLPQFNPADLIIVLGHNFSDLNQSEGKDTFRTHQMANIKHAWASNAIAQALNASQTGQVYFIPAYLCLGLPGPIGTNLYLNELQQQLLEVPIGTAEPLGFLLMMKKTLTLTE